MVVVGARGFEPPAFRSRTERATRLRHAPIFSLDLEAGRAEARLTFPRRQGRRKLARPVDVATRKRPSSASLWLIRLVSISATPWSSSSSEIGRLMR